MSEAPLTLNAQVARRRARRALQDEMGSDWTEGRQLAHDEAEALVRRQRAMSRRVTLAPLAASEAVLKGEV